jgi:hypothetical protein
VYGQTGLYVAPGNGIVSLSGSAFGTTAQTPGLVTQYALLLRNYTAW